MEYVGMDIGRKQSHLARVTEDGEVQHVRIKTTREDLTKHFGARPGARVLVEASASSEWIARHLEAMGLEVVVADPNFAPMYAQRTRKIKTDRRDAEALAMACATGNYKRAHRLSDSARLLRARVQIRKTLVRARAKAVAQTRALLAPHGIEVATGSTRCFTERLRRAGVPEVVAAELLPLSVHVEDISEQLDPIEDDLKQLVSANPEMARLMTVPGLGPVTAATWVATLDHAGRFDSGRQLAAFLGLVPREWSSSEVQRKGGITKVGPRELRDLLIEDAWRVMRCTREASAPLRAWALAVAKRRGRQKAAVALARRIARIALACWRDETAYDPARCVPRTAAKVID